MFFKKKILITSLTLMTLIGCTNNPFQDPYSGGLNKKTGGTLSGAAAGALAGQLIGGNTKGTLIGAGIGALAGLGWGAYRDKQEAELRERLRNSNVDVRREGDYISLTLPGGVTFQTNSSTVASSFYEPLNSIASVLIQYPESIIQVYGFTDNVGSPDYNLSLSQKRSSSVATYLTRRGVNSGRISTTGYGANYFVASNDSAQGRALNRRVEIKILPPNR
ncbi:MAG: OmpA family protein [Fusobacteriaceae bacterium]